MQKLLIFFVVQCFISTSDSQSIQKVFNKGYANDIIHTPDGGFIITGNIETNTNDRIFLMKFDSAGNVNWLNNYHDWIELYSYGTKVIDIPGGGYVCAGMMFNDTTSNEEISLLKCDSAGNLIWSKSFGNPFRNDEVTSIVGTQNGFLLGGFTSGYGAGGEEFYLLKTDTAGTILWSKTFGSTHDERGVLLLPSQNGFVFGGYGQEDTSGESDICLTYLDSSLNIITSLRIAMSGNQQLYDMCFDIDGNLLIAGTTDAGLNSPHALFIKLSPGGNVIWCNALQGNFSIPYHIRQSPQGLIATGAIYTQLFLENGFVIEMDSSGNLLNENYFGDSTGCIIKSFLINNNNITTAGSFMLPASLNTSIYLNKYVLNDSACNHFTGNNSLLPVTNNTSALFWFTNTPNTPELNAFVIGFASPHPDSSLCDLNPVTEEIASKISFSITPNPASENFSIILDNELFDSSIIIYNSQGEIVKQIRTSRKMNTLSTKNIPSGIYTVLVKNKYNISSHRLIIQH